MSFGTLDWLVLGAFVLALLGIVVWVALQKEEDTETISRPVARHLAGHRRLIFASNIGSEHWSAWLRRAQYAWPWLTGSSTPDHPMLPGFSSIYCTQVFTTPEFLERRYTVDADFFPSSPLVSYVLTKVSVTVYAAVWPSRKFSASTRCSASTSSIAAICWSSSPACTR
jgi:SSS family solute:Na+ symporter